MPNPRKLAPVPTLPAQRSELRNWRADLDPLSMPPMESLTPGQSRVLLACVQLFAEQGYAASSIRDIAAAAGMQSASLYNHFPSKEAMLTELIGFGYDFHLDRVINAVINAGSDPREQLFAGIREHVLVHCEHPLFAVVVTTEVRHLPEATMPRVLAVTQRSRALIIEILRRGAEQGVFLSTGHHVAVLAMASMGVDSARWFPFQTEFGAVELAEDFARLALRMVAAECR